MRRLTIGYVPDRAIYRRLTRFYPKIRLEGLWLEKLGWVIGERVEIAESPEEIVIRKTKGEIQEGENGQTRS